MMDISYTTPLRPHTTGTATINGAKITVMFDTGAWNSVLSMKAAARAGVKPDTPGVVEAGYSSGIGRGRVKSYIAPFSSFKIGDGEEIKNARLRIADIDLDEGDMLLGADFFLSHHVFVANSQHRLYLTYNGGPGFQPVENGAARRRGRHGRRCGRRRRARRGRPRGRRARRRGRLRPARRSVLRQARLRACNCRFHARI